MLEARSVMKLGNPIYEAPSGHLQKNSNQLAVQMTTLKAALNLPFLPFDNPSVTLPPSVRSSILRAKAAISLAPLSPVDPPSSSSEIDPRLGLPSCDAGAAADSCLIRESSIGEERMLLVRVSSSASSNCTIVYDQVFSEHDLHNARRLLTQTAICWKVWSELPRNRTRYVCRPPSGWFQTALKGA